MPQDGESPLRESVFETGIGLREYGHCLAPFPSRRVECLLEPRQIGGTALAVLRILLGRPSQVIVAAHQVQGGEGDAAHIPPGVLAESGIARVIALAPHRQLALAEALVVLEEDLPQLGEPIQRLEAPRLRKMTVRPVVVARCIDEGVAGSVN